MTGICTVFVICMFIHFSLEHPVYRDYIPNGLKISWAVGHVKGNGAGELSSFGIEFQQAGHVWTKELCLADTDGDGESNGLELGDPCCIWIAESNMLPSRSWTISHPARNGSRCMLAVPNCSIESERKSEKYFWDNYYRIKDDVERLSFWEYIITFLKDPKTALLSPGDMVKNISTLLLVVLMSIFIYGGVGSLSHKEILILLFISYLWTDLESGALHVILDNQRLKTWPILGEAAQSFQSHHDDPSGIAHAKLFSFLRDHHPFVVLIAMVSLVRFKDAKIRVFVLFTVPMTHLMMAAHRWSHTHPDELPLFILFLQKSGVLMTQNHHSMHHIAFEENFAIFSGWTNPLLNACFKIIPISSLWWVMIFFHLELFDTNFDKCTV